LFDFEKYYNVFIDRSGLVTSQHAAIVRTARENGDTFKVHDWTVSLFGSEGKL
jgi:hypothetical protein